MLLSNTSFNVRVVSENGGVFQTFDRVLYHEFYHPRAAVTTLESFSIGEAMGNI